MPEKGLNGLKPSELFEIVSDRLNHLKYIEIHRNTWKYIEVD
jgi:hypothetical protein